MHGHRIIRSLLAVVILIVSISAGFCWGPNSHRLITESAIQIMPDNMRPYYRANEACIEALSNLPDDWRSTHKEEAPNHYIDLDLFSKYPFTDLVGDRATIEKKLGAENFQKMGAVPWAIEEHYNKLVEAFRKSDGEQIVVQSAVLAHYVGDIHVPFHATKDYDGRTPDQKGIHARWEEIMPSMYAKSSSYRACTPAKVEGVLPTVFKWAAESWKLVDPILAADDKARTSDPTHSWLYYRMMFDETGAILQDRLSRAGEDVAGIWVSAWTEAGKPVLEPKPVPLYWNTR